jgi:hypothetical protein
MNEHIRPVVGGVLLSSAAACWITGVSVVASHAGHWSDPAIRGLLLAGALCFVVAVVLFASPKRPPKPPKAKSKEIAEVILKDAGIWPSLWQRLLHPRTPIGDLPVRVPDAVREQDRAYHEALQELLDELETNERDLGIELANDRTFGVMYSNTMLAKNQHVLRYDPRTSELVHAADEAVRALNDRTNERYDGASQDDVNNPKWLRLRERERQAVRDALEVVQDARAAVKEAKQAHP